MRAWVCVCVCEGGEGGFGKGVAAIGIGMYQCVFHSLSILGGGFVVIGEEGIVSGQGGHAFVTGTLLTHSRLTCKMTGQRAREGPGPAKEMPMLTHSQAQKQSPSWSSYVAF